MSRPRLSVPSQCWALGPMRAGPAPVSVGRGRGRTPATTASTATSTSQPRDTQKSTGSFRRAATSSADPPAETAAASVSSSDMADAGIEDPVEEVDEEVGEHVAHGNEQHRALDHHVVPLEDGLHGEGADARQREQVLDHEGTAHEPAQVEPG